MKLRWPHRYVYGQPYNSSSPNSFPTSLQILFQKGQHHLKKCKWVEGMPPKLFFVLYSLKKYSQYGMVKITISVFSFNIETVHLWLWSSLGNYELVWVRKVKTDKYIFAARSTFLAKGKEKTEWQTVCGYVNYNPSQSESMMTSFHILRACLTQKEDSEQIDKN